MRSSSRAGTNPKRTFDGVHSGCGFRRNSPRGVQSPHIRPDRWWWREGEIAARFPPIKLLDLCNVEEPHRTRSPGGIADHGTSAGRDFSVMTKTFLTSYCRGMAGTPMERVSAATPGNLADDGLIGCSDTIRECDLLYSMRNPAVDEPHRSALTTGSTATRSRLSPRHRDVNRWRPHCASSRSRPRGVTITATSVGNGRTQRDDANWTTAVAADSRCSVLSMRRTRARAVDPERPTRNRCHLIVSGGNRRFALRNSGGRRITVGTPGDHRLRCRGHHAALTSPSAARARSSDRGSRAARQLQLKMVAPRQRASCLPCSRRMMPRLRWAVTGVGSGNWRPRQRFVRRRPAGTILSCHRERSGVAAPMELIGRYQRCLVGSRLWSAPRRAGGGGCVRFAWVDNPSAGVTRSSSTRAQRGQLGDNRCGNAAEGGSRAGRC